MSCISQDLFHFLTYLHIYLLNSILSHLAMLSIPVHCSLYKSWTTVVCNCLLVGYVQQLIAVICCVREVIHELT